MKKKKLKGFTLIELIVVMAIFGVILVAAMQLLMPASKVLVQSEHYENQQAVVTNISDYLETVLAPAEFMDVYNGNQNTQIIAEEFATHYYEGVLKKGSTVDVPIPATGKIRILHIDNSGIGTDGVGNSKITSYVYDASFANGAVSVLEDPTERIDNAINNAYYNNYSLQIRVGELNESNWASELSQSELMQSVTPEKTVFTIRSETNTAVNGTVHTAYTTTFMSLSNIFTYTSTKELNYYVVDEVITKDDPLETATRIAQIGTSMIGRGDKPELLNARRDGTLSGFTRNTKIDTHTEAIEDYYFVYSYATDIDTN